MLRRVRESGGASSVLWSPPDSQPNIGAFFPAPLPGARGVLFTLCSGLCATSELWVVDLESGNAKQVLPDALRGWYLPTGHLVFVRRNGSMFAVPFDLKALQVRGTPAPVLEDLTLLFGVIPNIALSATGTLVMQAGGGGGTQLGLQELVWIDRSGGTTPVDSTWTFRHSFSNNNVGWSLSPDGRRLAIGLNTNSGDDIWIKAVADRPALPADLRQHPRGAPPLEARRQVCHLHRGRHQYAPAAPRGRHRQGGDASHDPGDAPRGILVQRTGSGWWCVPVAERVPSVSATSSRSGPAWTAPRRSCWPASRFDESAPALSPDGKWLAYASDETGRTEVYIRPFPNVDDGKWQVSTNGGQAPLWAHSGRELFYVDAERNMMVAPMPTGPSQLGARVRLFKLRDDLYLTAQEWYTPFDISPDDRRFLMSRQVAAPETQAPTFLLVENWFEELKSKMETR